MMDLPPNAALLENVSILGPFVGGPECRQSFLRNRNVPRNYSCEYQNSLMSPVNFKKSPCHGGNICCDVSTSCCLLIIRNDCVTLLI